MLGRQPRPAQDFIKSALHHPQHQSREAGSCLGAKQPELAESGPASVEKPTARSRRSLLVAIAFGLRCPICRATP